ncbi:uncharacterized protein LTR77_004565 [Saxophila tyrrhenica]|uniref:Zf-CHY-domain-containing protein n=1 Tax=Saxophila tyrrhenica TaxID=1690608 RepID=A0AAV9PDF8_9PEZI|nr:hypothetical protein LTR77_004565 [Saxophila tyrrhenica]
MTDSSSTLPQEVRRTPSRNRAATYPPWVTPNHNDDEDDPADLLNQLIGGSYARSRLPVSRFEGTSPARWSAPAWTSQSVNPAREVEIDLRNRDFVSEADEASLRSGGGGSEQEMEGSRDKMDSALPANDGMSELRQQLQQIRKLAISTEEKARRMHGLMVQDYMDRNGTAGNVSPMSLDGGDAKSFNEEPAALDVGLAALPIDPSNPYNLRPGDLELSFSPLPHIPTPPEDGEENMEEEDPIILGCMHYKRNVKVQCFDCHRWFPCRYCHDQSHDLPFPHNLRRKMTRNMMCMLCRTPQPAAETCENCGEYAAYYFCPKCKLWDNDSNKRIYHCDDCGICRLGEGLGKDFVHCKKCDVCISIATSAAHTCVENATKGPCPLCLDEMFASRAKVVSLPCGHYMHAECYRDLMAVTYKCPVCSRSAVNMELQWRKLDDEILAQPMPEDDEELNGLLPHLEHEPTPDHPELSPALQPRRPRKVWIGCNDCNNRSSTPFHWLGLKCQHCDSYNTNQMAPTAGHIESEAERLMRQQQVPQHQQELTGNAVLRAAGIGAEDTQARVDSALDVPSSPASYLAVPASPGSPSSQGSSNGLPSPRRYFVRDDDEPRRPSFTTPRFSAPTLPTLPNLPEMPRLPRMPNLPNLPNMPNMPNMPDYWPNMPELGLPNLPEFGRFSGLPYQMFDSLSRSLSPMRYYLQGLDVRDADVGPRLPPWRERGRERRASRLSVRSDPTADGTGGWSDVAVDDDDDDDEDDELDDGDNGESGSEESEDVEMADDEDEDENEDEVDDGMELFGHR